MSDESRGVSQEPTSPAAPEPPRSGWGAPFVLTLFAATLSVINPALILLVPLALAGLSLPPRRPQLVIAAALILIVVLAGRSGDALWWVGRGWALLLGAWFVIAIAVVPAKGFINRGLAAVFGAAATAGLLMLFTSAGWTRFDAAVSDRLKESARLAGAQWGEILQGTSAGADAGVTMERIANVQATLHPALLALASLCALAVAWHLWRRFALRDPSPLERLREFRFTDELIWVLVGGVILLVLPLNAAATRTGTNITVFMSVLYALRGAGVLISLFGTPGPLGVMFTAMAVLFLLPMVAAATLVLGLSDTWLDLRKRARRAQAESD